MNQIERIQYMESIMEEMEEVLLALREDLEKYRSLGDKIKELELYYGSELWRRDFEDDSEGKLPADLKRGILSEDGLWDLLAERESLLSVMSQMAESKKDVQD